VSVDSEAKLKHYARLCGEFISTPDLRRFIEANPEVLTDEAHMVFAAIIGKTVSQNADRAQASPDRVKEVVGRLKTLRRAIDSGLEAAFMVETLRANPGAARLGRGSRNAT
jgi:hypothetical protein